MTVKLKKYILDNLKTQVFLFSFFKLTVFAYRDSNATFFSGAHFLDSLVINGSST